MVTFMIDNGQINGWSRTLGFVILLHTYICIEAGVCMQNCNLVTFQQIKDKFWSPAQEEHCDYG